jgi:hypothetical protein
MNEQRKSQRRRSVLWTARIPVTFGLVLAIVVGVARGSTQQAPPVNTSPPTISGRAQEGQTLTAIAGVWTGDQPIGFSFQWQRCDPPGGVCDSMSGVTAQQYVVQPADVGNRLRVIVTATNSAGSAPAASAVTGVVVVAGSAPAPVKQPDPHGLAQVGQVVSVDQGMWSGIGPFTFAYQWQRCPVTGSACISIPGATNAGYIVNAVDLGFRLRAVVTVSNAIGSASAPSNLTTVVTQAGAPVNTGPPGIANASQLAEGNTATGTAGAWTGNQPITFAFEWSRCNATGANCQTIGGEVRSTYVIRQADVGFTLLFTVRASNVSGSTVAVSAPTAPIRASGLPAGAIRLPDGRISIPASSVSLPHRLVISDVKFSPTIVTSRNPFSGRFRVIDTRGYVVRDALVYVIGLPYSYVRGLPEIRTDQDGWAAMSIVPTGNLPLRKGGAIVFFVRVRKDGGNVLAGVSARRLVQVRVGRGV